MPGAGSFAASQPWASTVLTLGAQSSPSALSRQVLGVPWVSHRGDRGGSSRPFPVPAPSGALTTAPAGFIPHAPVPAQQLLPDPSVLSAAFSHFSEKCVMNNYFGIGLDAKISLEFNNKRDEHPKKCRLAEKHTTLPQFPREHPCTSLGSLMPTAQGTIWMPGAVRSALGCCARLETFRLHPVPW